MRLAHRIVIVPGGGIGVGEAIAKVFAREGTKGAITGRRQDELERVVEDIERTRNDSQEGGYLRFTACLATGRFAETSAVRWSMSHKGTEGRINDEQRGQR